MKENGQRATSLRMALFRASPGAVRCARPEIVRRKLISARIVARWSFRLNGTASQPSDIVATRSHMPQRCSSNLKKDTSAVGWEFGKCNVEAGQKNWPHLKFPLPFDKFNYAPNTLNTICQFLFPGNIIISNSDTDNTSIHFLTLIV